MNHARIVFCIFLSISTATPRFFYGHSVNGAHVIGFTPYKPLATSTSYRIDTFIKPRHSYALPWPPNVLLFHPHLIPTPTKEIRHGFEYEYQENPLESSVVLVDLPHNLVTLPVIKHPLTIIAHDYKQSSVSSPLRKHTILTVPLVYLNHNIPSAAYADQKNDNSTKTQVSPEAVVTEKNERITTKPTSTMLPITSTMSPASATTLSTSSTILPMSDTTQMLISSPISNTMLPMSNAMLPMSSNMLSAENVTDSFQNS